MPKYTTRSAIETSYECPRKRFFNYFFDGTGIVPVGEYVPLVTGGALHAGIEYASAEATIKDFDNQVVGSFFVGLEEAQQDYTYWEQRALAEALTWVWLIKEQPGLEQNYETLSIEKEYQIPLDSKGELVLLARPDRLLRDRQSGELYCYSIKSAKSWYERMEKAYRVDLQGFTEAIAVSYQTKQKVLGTRFCFLIKGRREKVTEQIMEAGMIIEQTQWVTHSPLIYGYASTEGKLAHSNKIIKQENISGFGKLPKKEGWEKFKVWEKYRIEKWVKALPKIQPELGNILDDQIVQVPEVHRTMSQLRSELIEIATTEQAAFAAYDRFMNGEPIEKCFSKNRRACHFPSDCSYLGICPNGNTDFDPAIADDPLGSEQFVRRVPHYETERLACGSNVSRSANS